MNTVSCQNARNYVDCITAVKNYFPSVIRVKAPVKLLKYSTKNYCNKTELYNKETLNK